MSKKTLKLTDEERRALIVALGDVADMYTEPHLYWDTLKGDLDDVHQDKLTYRQLDKLIVDVLKRLDKPENWEYYED